MANDAQDAARTKIFEQITAVASSIEDWNPNQQAEILRDLGAAYRFVSGGAQPGSSILNKST